MSCNGCPYQGSEKVKNYGSKNAKIAFLGEAPHTEELREGKPFVGRSGILLNSMLNTIGLSRNEILICNSLLCQIDKKETKKVREGMKHCRINLINTLKKVRPKLLVCLGDIAYRQAIRGSKILKSRGRFYYSEELGCDVFVTVHPAYIIRGATKGYPDIDISKMSAREKMFYMDFQTIKTYIENGYREPMVSTEDYTKVTKASDLSEIKNKTVAIDFELANSNIHDPANKLLSVSFSVKEGESKIVLYKNINKAIDKSVKDIITNTKTNKIVANRPFDEKAAKRFLGVEFGGNVFDVLTMAHVLDENQQINLENIAKTYTTLRNIKDLAEGMRGNLSQLPDDALIRYNGVDTDACIRSYNAMVTEYKENKSLTRYYSRFVKPIQDMLYEISWNGCKIDTNVLMKNEQELINIIEDARLKAFSEIPEVIKEKYKDNLSLGRSALVVDYLFKHPKGLKLKPVLKTAVTRQPATTMEHLNYFSNYPFVQNYFREKKALKLKNTYIKRLWNEIQKDGRIYPNILLIFTVTGRTVILRPELQTYPKHGEFAKYIREAIVADDGWLLGSRDLSQSELRIVGWLAQDPNILSALRNGIDLHTRTAERIVAPVLKIKKITPDLRHKAKPVNFGFIYLQTPAGFRAYAMNEYGIEFTLEESEAFQQAFFSKPNGYYMIPVYHNRIINQAREFGYVCSPLGRRRRLPNIKDSDASSRHKAERQAINHPVQSFSSDLGLLSMKLFQDEIKSSPKLKKNIKQLWFIHDEVLFTASEDYIEKGHEILKDCMENRTKDYIKKHFNIDVNYPIESDGKIGENWANMRRI